MKRTPKGYRIESGKVFTLLPTGDEWEGVASDCEVELWSIREELLKALKRAQEELRLIRMKDCNVVYDITLKIDMAAAIKAAERSE